MTNVHDLTVSQLAKKYLEDAIKNNDKVETDLYERELIRFVQWCRQGQILQELTPADIGNYTDFINGTGNTPQSSGRLLIIKEFLTYCKKNELIEKNLSQHVRRRKSKTNNITLTGPSMRKKTQLTPAGFKQLKEELEKLKAERVPLTQQIQKAAADKDVRENVPLEAAREQLGHTESRIRVLENTLMDATIIDLKKGGKKTVKLGSTISILEIDSKKRASYTLVSVTEAKPLEGRISDVSPMGKALYNRVKGDEFELNIAQGKSKFRILKVS
ncbi:MAG: hypothetical protein CL766_06310 [Chloroflexi bacterium]|nr:hypothetical protein [Chloroflexota bacterium]|tara:strand:- start:12815 stop:13633 length:819 start_codon:yes stop_codon:yes gene_type:complete